MNKFSDSPKTMVITLKDILDGTKQILYVSHDEDDGMWQFLDGSTELNTNDARLVSLEHILKLDLSLAFIYDLPLGWIAERKCEDSSWKRSVR